MEKKKPKVEISTEKKIARAEKINEKKNDNKETTNKGVSGASSEKGGWALKTKKQIKSHGRIFEGTVTKKFPLRVVIEFERAVYVRKYERYAKSKTKIHARLPREMEDQINVGDLIRVQECRPLSKIIHFIVIGKVEKKKQKTKEAKS